MKNVGSWQINKSVIPRQSTFLGDEQPLWFKTHEVEYSAENAGKVWGLAAKRDLPLWNIPHKNCINRQSQKEKIRSFQWHTYHRSNLTIHTENNRQTAGSEKKCWRTPMRSWLYTPPSFPSRVHSWPLMSPAVSRGVMYRGQERSHHKQHPSNFLFFLQRSFPLLKWLFAREIYPRKHAQGLDRNATYAHSPGETKGTWKSVQSVRRGFEKWSSLISLHFSPKKGSERRNGLHVGDLWGYERGRVGERLL